MPNRRYVPVSNSWASRQVPTFGGASCGRGTPANSPKHVEESSRAVPWRCPPMDCFRASARWAQGSEGRRLRRPRIIQRSSRNRAPDPASWSSSGWFPGVASNAPPTLGISQLQMYETYQMSEIRIDGPTSSFPSQPFYQLFRGSDAHGQQR
jgi:hypothetical protein